MDLQLAQEKIAERVRGIPCLAGLPVFAEELGNVIEKVQQEIAQTRFCVVVGSLAFSDEAPDSTLCYGTASVVVTVFEDPFLNREDASRPTYLKAAQEIAKALKLFDTGDGLLTSPSIGEPADLGDGIISCTVKLTTKTTL